MIIKILKVIIMALWFYVIDTISLITLSRYYYKKCKGNCENCKMWSCTNNTEYDGKAVIFPYENFKNVCGKEKFTIN